jgi:hypothetical protein
MEDPSTPRLASACGFSAILNIGIAGIYMLSDPKASSVVSTGVYVVSLGVILIVTGCLWGGLVRSTITHNYPNRANLATRFLLCARRPTTGCTRTGTGSPCS